MQEVLLTFAALIVVLALAYVTTRWLGGRLPNRSSGGIIRVVDKIAVSQDKLLLVVAVGGKTMLVAMTNQGAQKLCDLEQDDLMAAPVITDFSGAFNAALQDWRSRRKTKEGGEENDGEAQ